MLVKDIYTYTSDNIMYYKRYFISVYIISVLFKMFVPSLCTLCALLGIGCRFNSPEQKKKATAKVALFSVIQFLK